MKVEEIRAIRNHKLFRLADPKDRAIYTSLFQTFRHLKIVDTIEHQVKELIRIENPTRVFDPFELADLALKRIGEDSDSFGCWVYYPWLQSVVHILEEEDFLRLRTSRNWYKITPEEQRLLASKSIGVIGLSVGHAVVMALVMEGIGGEIRIADFDTLDLSNCNRIRTPLTNLGLKKTEMAKRDIAEVNPFLKVTLMEEGFTASNADAFFQSPRPLDLIIEECDSGDMKVLARMKASEYRVPLLMETSDRGVLDIERYDLDPATPLLHGRLTKEDYRPDLSTEEKRSILLKTIDFSKVSERGLMSMSEIGKTITTWPQLATDVISGGATVAMAARMILLGEQLETKRTYVDISAAIRGISA